MQKDVIRARDSLTPAARWCMMFRVTKWVLWNVSRLGLSLRCSLVYFQDPGKAVRVYGMCPKQAEVKVRGTNEKENCQNEKSVW